MATATATLKKMFIDGKWVEADSGRTLTMEQGKPVPEAKAEINHSADTFEWFAEEGKRAYGQVIPNSQPGKRHVTFKHPVGVVAAISPWNFPITLQSRKIAPALAVGCAIVCKPASQTPLSLVQVFECMIEAGLPQGVANLVVGPAQELGDEFLENPICRKISFTGSTWVDMRRSSSFPTPIPRRGRRSLSPASSATTARCASSIAGNTCTRM